MSEQDAKLLCELEDELDNIDLSAFDGVLAGLEAEIAADKAHLLSVVDAILTPAS